MTGEFLAGNTLIKENEDMMPYNPRAKIAINKVK